MRTVRVLVVLGLGLLLASCGRRNFNDDAMTDSVAADCGPPPPDCTDPVVYLCGANCYASCNDQVTRPVASTRCVAWGGCLATIRGQNANDCSVLHLNGESWIGLLQDNQVSAPEQGWHWCDNSDPTFVGWVLDKPDDRGGTESGEEQCALIQPGGGWEDIPCTETRPFVCSRPL